MPAPCSVGLADTASEGEGTSYSVVKVDVSALHSAFVGGTSILFVMFAWNRAVTDKNFLSCWSVPFLIFLLETAGFFLGHLLFVPFDVSPTSKCCQLLQHPVWNM